MRTLATTAVLVALAQTLLPPAVAQDLAAGNTGSLDPQICRIVSTDTVSMNFVCQTGNVARQYWVARATVFRARAPGASLFDLQAGERVQVVSHRSGRIDVADLVVS